jgi:hypothetical protein
VGCVYISPVIYSKQRFIGNDCHSGEPFFAGKLPEIRPSRRTNGLQGRLHGHLVVAGHPLLQQFYFLSFSLTSCHA